MRRWALAITVAFFAVVSVAAGAVALTDDDTPSGVRVARDADDDGASGGNGSPNIAPVCAPEVPDCEDMIVNPNGGGAAGICLEGAVDCDDTPSGEPPADDVCILIFPTPPECADPDSPVSNEPPLVDPPQTACDSTNAAECEKVVVGLATEDLARRLGSAEGIELKGVGFVEWPNACLGIEQPDVACAEIITPGYRVLLEADGVLYEYHTDTGSRALLVE